MCHPHPQEDLENLEATSQVQARESILAAPLVKYRHKSLGSQEQCLGYLEASSVTLPLCLLSSEALMEPSTEKQQSLQSMPCTWKEGVPSQLPHLSSGKSLVILQAKPRIPSQQGNQAVAKGLVCSFAESLFHLDNQQERRNCNYPNSLLCIPLLTQEQNSWQTYMATTSEASRGLSPPTQRPFPSLKHCPSTHACIFP